MHPVKIVTNSQILQNYKTFQPLQNNDRYIVISMNFMVIIANLESITTVKQTLRKCPAGR